MQFIGYACALEALLLSLIAYCAQSKYRQVPEDETDLFPGHRELSPMSNHKYDDYDQNIRIEMQTTSPQSNAQNHNNCNKLSLPVCNQTPYTPGKSEK